MNPADPARPPAKSHTPRIVRLIDDRAAVILSWPLFLLIDYLGAKCGEWDFQSHRAKTKAFLLGIWNRYSVSDRHLPNHQKTPKTQ